MFTDINFLRNGEDVIINFKDDASYSLDANFIYNDTEFDLDETFKKVCRKHGGEYVEGSWDIPRDCIINGNHMFYDEEGKSLNYDVYADSAFISGEKISSVTINGAPNRTQINMTQFDDYFALIPLAAYSGIINSNFEINNIKMNSLYLASNKQVTGKINNCEIDKSILAAGSVDIKVTNSLLNSIYALGNKNEDGNVELIEGAPTSPNIIVDDTNKFINKRVRLNKKT